MTSSVAWDEFPASVQGVIENCDCPICVHWKWWSSIVILMYGAVSKRGTIVDKLRHFSANQLICEGKGSKESGCPKKYTLYRGFNLANLVDKYLWGNGYISNLRKRNILDSKVSACRVFLLVPRRVVETIKLSPQMDWTPFFFLEPWRQPGEKRIVGSLKWMTNPSSSEARLAMSRFTSRVSCFGWIWNSLHWSYTPWN